jgi:very-short-patch-repair endonuclease
VVEPWHVSEPEGLQRATASVDRAIAALADAQHGVVALPQLTALGLGQRAISKRVASGRLHRLHRGVYAVGHTRLSAKGRWLAAVLACGPAAVLSHRTAAALHELLPIGGGAIHVTAPHRLRDKPGLHVHRAAVDRVVVDVIPATTVARTLLDLAVTEPYRLLERAVENAERKGTLDVREIPTVDRPGAPALRRALAAHTTHTESELERRVLALIERARLPRPQTNAPIQTTQGPIRVDFLWPEHRLVLEADGHEHHRTRHAQDRDRRRDQALTAAGYTVIRTTWTQVTQDPESLIVTLRALLRA